MGLEWDLTIQHTSVRSDYTADFLYRSDYKQTCIGIIDLIMKTFPVYRDYRFDYKADFLTFSDLTIKQTFPV